MTTADPSLYECPECERTWHSASAAAWCDCGEDERRPRAPKRPSFEDSAA